MTPEKTLTRVRGIEPASGAEVEGYEIHVGRTEGPDMARPWLAVGGRPEGAMDETGRVRGTYLHGLFASDGFRRAFLAGLGAAPSALAYGAEVETILDRLAGHLEAHCDVGRMLALAR
jgi:adenosylcobyric acid synthase